MISSPVSRQCLERLAELIPEMSPRDLTIAAGVATEKWLLLADQATSITINRDDQVKHTSFNDMLASLPTANARIIDSDDAAESSQ